MKGFCLSIRSPGNQKGHASLNQIHMNQVILSKPCEEIRSLCFMNIFNLGFYLHYTWARAHHMANTKVEMCAYKA